LTDGKSLALEVTLSIKPKVRVGEVESGMEWPLVLDDPRTVIESQRDLLTKQEVEIAELRAAMDLMRGDTMTCAAERNEALEELRKLRSEVRAASEFPSNDREADLKLRETVRHVMSLLRSPDFDALAARDPESLSAQEAAELGLHELRRDGRLIRFVAELATMTDTEADFLDGKELRTLAQMLRVPGEDAVVPRLYGEEDRKRAIGAIWGGVFGSHENAGRVVDAVAEALGMRRAGA
jgi:hypothetical protein